jgi:FkbM family methyltransferase
MFTSYAQNFEDVMLWRALRHVGNGFYIDIGAQDAIVDSVSMGFYEQGWRGVHVEPVESYVQRLRELRPDERVIQAAVGAQAGTLTLYQFDGTGLTTAVRDVAAAHVASGFAMREVSVPCTTLEQILAPYAGRDVHWMKIDVEGFEREALEGWRGDIRPWIVIVESTVPGTEAPSYESWESIVIAHGYRFVWFDGLNRFYVSDRHPELERAFDHGAGVFDDFALSGAATSSFCAIVNGRVETAIRESEILAARVREREEVAARLEASTASLHRQIEESRRHAQALQAHIEAMTHTLSWRITAPLRALRAGRAAGSPRASIAQGALALATRTAAYKRLAPWLRERHPAVWARAKRALLSAPVVGSNDNPLATAANLPTRGLIAHDTDDAEGFDALAARGSVSARELASLIEHQLARQRRA